MFGWRPEIGDPTVLGWATTFAYLAVFALCIRAARTVRDDGTAQAGRLAIAFRWLSLVMLGLGLNKQLDLQTLLTGVGKAVAVGAGLAERKSDVRRAFLVLLATGMGAFGVWALWWLRAHLRRLALAIVGVGALGAYVVVRAAFFNRMGGSGFAQLAGQWGFVLELGGIAAVGLCALRRLR